MQRIETSNPFAPRYLRIACLLLALIAPAISSAQTIRVASYNLYNYLVMDRSVDGKWRKDYPKPEAEKSALRRAILDLKPDILAIQEIGSPAFLREIRADLRAEGLDYPHTAHLQGPDPDRSVAFLSRLPPSRHHASHRPRF